jgi:hypothetical protein
MCELAARIRHGLLEARQEQFEKAGDRRIRTNQENVGASCLKDVPVVSRHSKTQRRRVADRQTPLRSTSNANKELWRQGHMVSSESGVQNLASDAC